MKTNILQLVALLALTALSTLASADPSGRVGRIAEVQGSVTFRNANGTEAATRNWPITSGNTITTNAASRAEIRVGSAAVRLDGNTDLDIVELDDNRFHLRLNRGSAVFHIRNTELARDVTIDTPQGHILLSEPSQLRIDVRDDSALTMLSVLSGSASFDGSDARFSVPAGRRAEVAGNELRVIELRTAWRDDDFDRWSGMRDRAEERSISARYVSTETTGYEVLDTHGEWRVTSLYGPVWSPRFVAVDWAPYRDGRWTWVAPWGWTWIDNAPWGYAPSHYGRWVWLDQRWCWAPGAVVARPVWAPALVGWVGGASPQGAYVAGGAPTVGWFPLAPRDVYVPAYQVSPHYVQKINNTVVNHVVVNNSVQVYQNRNVGNAVTMVPRTQFAAQAFPHAAPADNDRVRPPRAAPAVAAVNAAPPAMTTPPAPLPLMTQPPPAANAVTPAWKSEREEHAPRRTGDAAPHRSLGYQHEHQLQQARIERQEPRPEPAPATVSGQSSPRAVPIPVPVPVPVPAMQNAAVTAPLPARQIPAEHVARHPGHVRERGNEGEQNARRREHPDR